MPARARATRAAGAVLFGALALRPARAAADPAAREAAESACKRAEGAAAALRFAEALATYRAAIAADPSAPCARVAAARAGDLAAHAEGDFGPLARVEALRRDALKRADRAAIEALGRDADGFPDGRVRAEAHLLVAEAWWHVLGEPERAIAAFEAAVDDASGDPLTRALALADLCALRQLRGELRQALASTERQPALSPALHATLKRLVRRERIRAVAFGVTGLLAAIGVASVAQLALAAGRARDVFRRVVRPLPALASAFLAGGGALLVRADGGADPRPFLWLGLGIFLLDVVARAFRLAIGGGSRRVRLAWAGVCVVGVFCAAFLAAERVEPDYLDGFGL
jgi:tetratricopeptide (TPR) repeat protein